MQLVSLMNELGNMSPSEWRATNHDYVRRARIAEDCLALSRLSHEPDGKQARQALHDILATIYQRDFSCTKIAESECETQPVLRDIAAILEQSMLETEIAIARDEVEGYPTTGRDFSQWLKQLIARHPASRHPYYRPYVEDHATRDDLRFLLAQESSLDPRFDDILALIQLGTQGREKMEIAGNYWDEMGNGRPGDVHSSLFSAALAVFGIDEKYICDSLLLEAKLCGNLSAALALSRRHYYKAIGYFGVTEYLAPRRFRCLVAAWKRLELPPDGISYHEIHIEIDAGHAVGWLKNVIEPAIDRDPDVGYDIAVGTIVRLNTSARYLDALLARTNFMEIA